MNQSTIFISSCMAVSALLFPSFIDQAHAACNPPKDVSSCWRVQMAIFAQASPALPEPPFVVTDPHTRNTLALTYFDEGPGTSDPRSGRKTCNPSNVSGCAWVSSVDLTKRAPAKKSTPFLVRFQDGRSLLASPMPKQ
jgi:hypothetical protein